eukprot:GDKK01045933.1.p1 GENE.GDKK01045933.1~~GDKK01045933.1.p1  ORF type:complete len:134 (-),score=13.68 GDKK01045933.1:76-477(-)
MSTSNPTSAAKDTELASADAANNAIYSEPPPSRYARYKAEQERHLIKVNNKATDMKNKARFLFFPFMIIVVVGLLFYSIEPATENGVPKLSRKARRRLEELQKDIGREDLARKLAAVGEEANHKEKTSPPDEI